MQSQIRVYKEMWRTFTPHQRKMFVLRITASIAVFIIGCGIIFNMRAKTIGEDGASLAMYCLGTLFILTMNLMIFSGKLAKPEALALKMCLAAIIFTGAWVNIEEKVVMPMLSADCKEECVMTYERVVPFADVEVMFVERRGWRTLR